MKLKKLMLQGPPSLLALNLILYLEFCILFPKRAPHMI